MKKVGLFFICLLMIILLFISGNLLYNHYYSKSPHFTKQYDKPGNPDLTQSNLNQSIVKILIINGGGVDGLMPLYVLQYLEKQTGKPISELFDLFVGTSSGSIITSSLNIPDENGKPKFSTTDIINVFENFSKSAIESTLARKILTLNGLFGPKYEIDNLYQELKKTLGKNIQFNQLLKKVSIVSFNLNKVTLELFNNWEVKKPYVGYPVIDLLTAAAATPACFSSVIINKEAYVDGCTFANNPTLYSIHNAFDLYPNASKYIIVHLGTGSNSPGSLIYHLGSKNNITATWGEVQWITPAGELLYVSQDQGVKEALHIIKTISPKGRFKDFYFNKLTGVDPFDPSEINFQLIKKTAYQLIEEQKNKLNILADLLVNL